MQLNNLERSTEEPKWKKALVQGKKAQDTAMIDCKNNQMDVQLKVDKQQTKLTKLATQVEETYTTVADTYDYKRIQAHACHWLPPHRGG